MLTPFELNWPVEAGQERGLATTSLVARSSRAIYLCGTLGGIWNLSFDMGSDVWMKRFGGFNYYSNNQERNFSHPFKQSRGIVDSYRDVNVTAVNKTPG